jgi:MoaA/NifB/PqqE/SkfB family radical SAM enzyme
MHSDLFRLCRLLNKRGLRTTILSSGILLERHAEAIVTHVDDVIVSLDGPAEIHNRIRGVPRAFEMLAAGVSAIHRFAPRFPVAARCTVQAQNAGYLCASVQAAKEIRLRSISFLAADLSSGAFNRAEPWPLLRQEQIAPDPVVLDPEIERLVAANDPFVLESPAKLRRIAAHFHGQHTAPRCNAPWVSAVVETNGNVRPCFFQPAIGNTADGTLASILNSPRAIAFRESLNIAEDPICRRCVCSLYVPLDAAVGSGS